MTEDNVFRTASYVHKLLMWAKECSHVTSRTFRVLDDAYVVQMDFVDDEGGLFVFPKGITVPESEYDGDAVSITTTVGEETFEDELTPVEGRAASILADQTTDSVETMYGTAIPEHIDVEKVQELTEQGLGLAQAFERLRRASELADEENVSVEEALDRLGADSSNGATHECSYCGLRATLDTDEERVVSDCDRCEKRRYFEKMEDEDDE